jgi:thiamine-phosphate pyrophosphorylase
MVKVAKLASRLNCPRRQNASGAPASGTEPLPVYFLLTDHVRLPDPTPLLERLPLGAVIVMRHTDPDRLRPLARALIPRAHALGLKVLLAGDVRTALKLKCDGVHLSQDRARRGHLRIQVPPKFLITAAAHNAFALRRAALAGAHMVLLSPVFVTESHPQTKPLGVLRFSRLSALSPLAVAALGGITPTTVKRLRHALAFGPVNAIAAIGGWRDDA